MMQVSQTILKNILIINLFFILRDQSALPEWLVELGRTGYLQKDVR